jgi:glucosylceramidase
MVQPRGIGFGQSMRLALAGVALLGAPVAAAKPPIAQGWTSSSDGKQRLEPLPPIAIRGGGASGPVIKVDPDRQLQRIEGFGAAITDSSAWLIRTKLSPRQRKALMRELFDTRSGIGLEATRLTLGASDFSRSHYSYDDMPAGEVDPYLRRFSIAPAKADVIPVARDALAINRRLRIFLSPWSAPGWMKSSQSLIKGRLLPEHYDAFARYLWRSVAAFEREGVPIYALTIQNEPAFEPPDYPGMLVTPAERADLIGNHLGPLLTRKRARAKIFEWDHNWDKPEQPLAVLADAKARKYISGVAWHCYGGNVSAHAKVQVAYPEMESWHTECSGGSWAPDWGGTLRWMTQNLIIGTVRSGGSGTILWNLALDEKSGPHLGGCGNCRPVVTIDQATGNVTRNVEYYVLGHASKFVRSGARRIASEGGADGIEHVAFQNPGSGSLVLIAVNGAKTRRAFSVEAGGQHFVTSLDAGAVSTFVWDQKPDRK